MKFETWLRKQKHRNDGIGDLAKDFIDAYRIIWNEERKRATIIDTFFKFTPSSGAEEAYQRALKEYRKLEK